jgi:hypothetical protein
MTRGKLVFGIAKVLEGAGLIVILVGVYLSVNLGFQDKGLESMNIEFRGLAIGAALFVCGVLLERTIGSR